MKKSTFVKIMNSLQKSSDTAENIENGIISVLEKNNRAEFAYSGAISEMYCDSWHQEEVLDALREEFDDKDDWIGYFVYELYWGRKYEDGKIIDADGTIIKLASPADLYDFLEETSKSEKESVCESHIVNDPMTIKDVEHIIEKYLERRKYN